MSSASPVPSAAPPGSSGHAPRHLVVMGVSGSGKTTVARQVAARLGWELLEGDDLHPAANVAKMAAGIPLDDADREPWLRALAAWTAERDAAGRSTVLTCSALKRRYRDLLAGGAPGRTEFVLLAADPAVLRERMTARSAAGAHFMPTSLLDSQLATLEPLQPDEPGCNVDAGPPVEQVVQQVLAVVGPVSAG